MQELACDKLAEALLLVTEASRLDGRAAFDRADLRELAARVGRGSSAFGLDVIVARAIERRASALGLRGGTAELFTLVEDQGSPLETLSLSDEEFRTRAEELEAELGEFS
jgi:hypothetical protein